MDSEELVRTAIGVTLLLVLTYVVLWGAKAPHRLDPPWAIFRGALQLALISLVLSSVIRSELLVGAALLVMFGVAAATSTRRIGWSWRHLGLVITAMGIGITASMVIVFGTGAIDLTARYTLAIGGIVIGNTMNITTLAGRRLLESIDTTWDEVEGWLALGATPRQATISQARAAVYAALVPATDQTKTTGLVTLPGAFVGAIFGGVSPLEAGRFQIVVLAAIMAAGSLTAVVVVRSLAPVRVRPVTLG